MTLVINILDGIIDLLCDILVVQIKRIILITAGISLSALNLNSCKQRVFNAVWVFLFDDNSEVEGNTLEMFRIRLKCDDVRLIVEE